MKVIRKIRYKRKPVDNLKLPEGFIPLEPYGYGGTFTKYFANPEGQVISIYFGLKLRVRYVKVHVQPKSNLPVVRLSRAILDSQKKAGSIPVLQSTVAHLVKTGTQSVRGKRLSEYKRKSPTNKKKGDQSDAER